MGTVVRLRVLILQTWLLLAVPCSWRSRLSRETLNKRYSDPLFSVEVDLPFIWGLDTHHPRVLVLTVKLRLTEQARLLQDAKFGRLGMWNWNFADCDGGECWLRRSHLLCRLVTKSYRSVVDEQLDLRATSKTDRCWIRPLWFLL